MLLYRKKKSKKNLKKEDRREIKIPAQQTKPTYTPRAPHTPTRGAHPSVIMTVPAV